MTDEIDTEPETVAQEKSGFSFRSIFPKLRRFLENVIYLGICLSVLETYRTLVLLQVGVNQFGSNYVAVLTAALVLGKLVIVAEHLPFFEVFDDRPLVWPVLYKSALMTIFVSVFRFVEERFLHISHPIPPNIDVTALTITHYVAVVFIFFVFFSIRGLQSRLGPSKLTEIFLGPQPQRDLS